MSGMVFAKRVGLGKLSVQVVSLPTRKTPMIKSIRMMLLTGLAATIALVTLLNWPLIAQAGTTATIIVVNTTDDEISPNGNCTLREAIQAANTHSVVDACTAGRADNTVIDLPAGTYTLTIPGAGEDDNASGDLDLKANITLHGIGAGPSRISGNRMDRVLDVHLGAKVLLLNVEIIHGKTVDGPPAGCDGSSPCPAENGGGILNAGTLILTGTTIAGNAAGSGGSCSSANTDCTGEPGGDGGGIFNLGTLVLHESMVLDNLAGSGGAYVSGTAASGGFGGGIYNAGILTVSNSTVTGNSTGAGGPELCTAPYCPAAPGGDGGGIYNLGVAALIGSTIFSNTTAGGGAPGGRGGDGGGIANQGKMTIMTSTLYDNRAGDGGACGGYRCGLDAGRGGGIANSGSLAMLNCTVSGNRTGNGADVISVFGAPGNGGNGGGIYNAGTLTLDNCTIADNAGGRGGSSLTSGPAGVDGVGGGLAVFASPGSVVHIKNTILAGNLVASGQNDCNGNILSDGYNLLQTVGHCTIGGETIGNLLGVDARLAPLADYGGLTLTYALHQDSLAVDAGSCTGIASQPIKVDQRGVPRPQFAACDIGAYEFRILEAYLPLVAR